MQHFSRKRKPQTWHENPPLQPKRHTVNGAGADNSFVSGGTLGNSQSEAEPMDHQDKENSNTHGPVYAEHCYCNMSRSKRQAVTGLTPNDPRPTVVVIDQGTQTDETVFCSSGLTMDNSTQTAYSNTVLKTTIDLMIEKNRLKQAATTVVDSSSGPKEHSPLLSLNGIKNNDNLMRHFTGLTFLHFMALLNFLGPAVNKLKYWQSKKKRLRGIRQ